MNENPIFLLGAHKSGTSLLRSIFDGHSQLFVIPFEAHFFQNMNYWVDNEYRKQHPRKLNQEEIIENFCAWIHHCNISEDRFADSITKGMFNEKYFREKISEINSLNDLDLINKYFEAIHYSIFKETLSNEKRIVEKSVENAEFVLELCQIYPKAKYIHIVRNPYSNFVALRRYKSQIYGYALLHRIVSTLYNSYYFLYKNKKLIKNYYTIKYENLVSNSKHHIKKLCEFVEIDFEDVLLTPTTMGKLWAGNSTSGKIYSGISSSNLDKWKNEIYPVEVFYVNKLFSFVFQDYGYEIINPHGSFWRKVPGENLKRYLANRFYKYFCK